jgi:hypothetical protein
VGLAAPNGGSRARSETTAGKWPRGVSEGAPQCRRRHGAHVSGAIGGVREGGAQNRPWPAPFRRSRSGRRRSWVSETPQMTRPVPDVPVPRGEQRDDSRGLAEEVEDASSLRGEGFAGRRLLPSALAHHYCQAAEDSRKGTQHSPSSFSTTTAPLEARRRSPAREGPDERDFQAADAFARAP